MKRRFAPVCLVVSVFAAWQASAEASPTAVHTGTPRRVIAADSSTKTMASISPDGRVEWKLPCGHIHDLHLLPDGTSMIVEVTPEKQVVRTFKDFQAFGNSLPVAVVLDP